MLNNVIRKGFILHILLCLSFMMPLMIYGAADQTDISSGRELLLFQDLPFVITASKVEQPILESPSTITVLTRDDIERYGITSFTDILRNVPGVDVISISTTDRNIAIRGFNTLASGRVLSLVDGIPVYLDLYGLTSWEVMPVSIEEIERIEIIRGPGSALYGANAFCGVVNIITDSPMKSLGTKMTTKVNHAGKLSGSVIHGEQYGDLNYKTSMGWNSMDGWDDENTGAGGSKKFNGHLRYAPGQNSEIRLYGNIAEHQGDIAGLAGFEPIAFDTNESNLKTDYLRSNIKLQLFYRRVTSEGSMNDLTLYDMETEIIDSDFQYSFRPVSRNFVTWGLNWKFNRTNSNVLDGLHSQNILGTYIQDQIRLSRSLNLTTGLRYDRHPLTGNNFSPRASLVYSRKSGHAIRASIGRAFRNPAFVYSYICMDYIIATPFTPNPINVKVRGNKELSPEWITSLELGYQGRFGKRLKLGTDVFVNRLENLSLLYITGTYDADALFPGSPGGIIPSVISTINTGDADAYGGELTMDLSITSWLKAYANYSYQHVVDSETGQRVENSPTHKLNPAIKINLGRNFLLSLFANYVSAMYKGDKLVIDPYMMFNSVIGYRLGSTKIGLSVSNLLDDRHIEHPDGGEIGRSVVLSLTYKIR